MAGLEIHPLSDLRDEAATLLAERYARQRVAEGDLRVPAHNIDLAHAATLDDVRGTGVGLALTAHALQWAHDNGFRSMTTDWRVVNLLSSRFWPRRGFRPQYLRLYRAVP
jgi:GNAT superfamily N-acetyltransferase